MKDAKYKHLPVATKNAIRPFLLEAKSAANQRALVSTMLARFEELEKGGESVDYKEALRRFVDRCASRIEAANASVGRIISGTDTDTLGF